MGANFVTTTIKARTENKLRERFTIYQKEMCHQYGHDSYAGHMGIASGLRVLPGDMTMRQAEKMFNEDMDRENPRYVKKWEQAVAIKIRRKGYYLVVALVAC